MGVPHLLFVSTMTGCSRNGAPVDASLGAANSSLAVTRSHVNDEENIVAHVRRVPLLVQAGLY